MMPSMVIVDGSRNELEACREELSNVLEDFTGAKLFVIVRNKPGELSDLVIRYPGPKDALFEARITGWVSAYLYFARSERILKLEGEREKAQ